MRVDPSVSWGDIAMTTGLVFSGILAFASVSQGVSLNAASIKVIDRDVQLLAQEHRARLSQEKADREQLRLEMREDLRAISEKLDQLMQRSDGE
jgi:Skp family chaperone for outer membrane proteins